MKSRRRRSAGPGMTIVDSQTQTGRELSAPVVFAIPTLRLASLLLLLPLPGQHVVLDARAALPLGSRPALRIAVEAAPARAAEARAQAPWAVLGAGRPDIGRQNGCEGRKSDQDTHR